jgi:hypothetical protein
MKASVKPLVAVKEDKARLVRPSDRCRGLAGEDQCQGWRLRHRVSDAPLGALLTVIFARPQDAGARRTARLDYAGASHWGSVTARATGLRVRVS